MQIKAVGKEREADEMGGVGLFGEAAAVVLRAPSGGVQKP